MPVMVGAFHVQSELLRAYRIDFFSGNIDPFKKFLMTVRISALELLVPLLHFRLSKSNGLEEFNPLVFSNMI